MKPIIDNRITQEDGKFLARCKCGKLNAYTTKARALTMLEKEVCRYCRPKYQLVVDKNLPIYKRDDGRWCCRCSGCDKEQAYTRKDHAKQSYLNDWQCKKCTAIAKGFSSNMPVGDKKRLFNRIYKTAQSRGIVFDLTEEQMFEVFDGMCSLTGWKIDLSYSNNTASLDRIDSNKGYVVGNIQWVHKMVNMMKNKYSQEQFVEVCKAVARKL
jgi:hypothetical protein